MGKFMTRETRTFRRFRPSNVSSFGRKAVQSAAAVARLDRDFAERRDTFRGCFWNIVNHTVACVRVCVSCMHALIKAAAADAAVAALYICCASRYYSTHNAAVCHQHSKVEVRVAPKDDVSERRADRVSECLCLHCLVWMQLIVCIGHIVS